MDATMERWKDKGWGLVFDSMLKSVAMHATSLKTVMSKKSASKIKEVTASCGARAPAVH